MKLKAAGMVLCVSMAMTFSAAIGGERNGRSVLRDDLTHMTLGDGSKLCIRTQVHLDRQHTAKVWVVRHRLGSTNEKKRPLWAGQITSVKYVPGLDHVYALVKEMEDRIFIFTLWSRRHFTIDKDTGRVIEEGQGDEALKKYGHLLPLKLNIIPPSTGRKMTQEELEELEELERRDAEHGRR